MVDKKFKIKTHHRDQKRQQKSRGGRKAHPDMHRVLHKLKATKMADLLNIGNIPKRSSKEGQLEKQQSSLGRRLTGKI